MTKLVADPRARLARLWRAAFGEPPAIDAEPRLLAEILVRCLPPVLPYTPAERLAPEAEDPVPEQRKRRPLPRPALFEPPEEA